MRRTQLVHLARVAESAAAELPDIAQKFRLSREGVPYLAFRTAARGMSAEAQNQKEILVKHGLLDSVLESLRAHVGASAELDVLGEELTQIVRLMDGLNRYRFADDADSLAGWESASNVVGPPRRADRRSVGRAVRARRRKRHRKAARSSRPHNGPRPAAQRAISSAARIAHLKFWMGAQT